MLDNLILGAGLGYTFGIAFPYPVGIVQWDINDRLALNALLPFFATLSFEASDMLDLGVKAQVDFRGHHGDPDRYGVDNPQLSYLNIKAGPYVQVNVGECAHFNFEGGYYL